MQLVGSNGMQSGTVLGIFAIQYSRKTKLEEITKRKVAAIDFCWVAFNNFIDVVLSWCNPIIIGETVDQKLDRINQSLKEWYPKSYDAFLSAQLYLSDSVVKELEDFFSIYRDLQIADSQKQIFQNAHGGGYTSRILELSEKFTETYPNELRNQRERVLKLLREEVHTK